MTFRENVGRLCDQLGIVNPIQEESLTIAKVVFTSSKGRLEVFATDMNRAGRLFLQSRANGITQLQLHYRRADAATFFTPEFWGDCSAEKRTLIFGLKTYDFAYLTYK